MSIRAKVIGLLGGVFNLFANTSGLTVRKPGGTAGTDEMQMLVTGTANNGSCLIASMNNSNSGLNAFQRGASGAVFGLYVGGNYSAVYATSSSLSGTVWGISSTQMAVGVAVQIGWGDGTIGNFDTGFKRAASTVVAMTNGSTGVGWIQNSAGESRRTATQTVTDSAALAADNTLTATLIAGRKYRFRIRYYMTTVNSSGVQVDLNGGAATMTAINGFTKILSSAGAVLAAGQIAALTTAVGVTASGTFAVVEIEGSLQCNAAGTFIPRFAQNAETGAAESVVAQIGSFMELSDVP